MDIIRLKEKFSNSWLHLLNTQNQPVGQLAP